MKDYSIRAIADGAERTFHVRAYDWADAQGQVDQAYKGHQEYNGVIEITELSTLPGADATPPTPQETPGVYSPADSKYWDYIRDDIRCYESINPIALAGAFEIAQEEGCFTPSQMAAIATVIEDAVSHTAAYQGLTA